MQIQQAKAQPVFIVSIISRSTMILRKEFNLKHQVNMTQQIRPNR
jgi:hypothetical protein